MFHILNHYTGFVAVVHTQGKKNNKEFNNYALWFLQLAQTRVILSSLSAPVWSSFSPKPACRDATQKPLRHSDVCCYITRTLKCVWKKKRRASVTKTSLFKQSNCLLKYCHSESQRQMAHLFLPFELSSWILPGRPCPVGGGHGNRKCKRIIQFQNLPHWSAVGIYPNIS